MLNDSTWKTVFNAKWHWPFKVICFDVDEKPLGDYRAYYIIIMVSYMKFGKI